MFLSSSSELEMLLFSRRVKLLRDNDTPKG